MARAVVLRQLTMAPRSRAQLAEKLATKNVPADVAEAVLDRFTDVGLIDDAAFADMLVRSRQQTKGLARRALAQDLRRKGVDDETARAALETVTGEDEEAAARALVRRKLRSTRGVEPAKRAQRLAAMLARKGYGAGLAYRVVRETLAEEGDVGGAGGGDDAVPEF
ncbi:regulatory protein [Kineococcus xinjiangensis]|uniref:Regulatory protein RecX n=1 Tax=Kineococcus xinjiangensis TaxID=512762 RepID=A0A2S6IVT4_9ACTN|nr:regulatory protein RecX [Kineococcus xinjiangensis]PPK98458.1 regulatory protein [Kineococcus xinjiangensis]